MKHAHEFRDPIHTFITVRSDERRVIDSRPFQRLRQIHQLALTYLVYPGATHRRFEHSLGVMELATRVFDTVTSTANVIDASVREIIPDDDSLRYWRTVLRMAALCHDMGHLPFSHAAEAVLLPSGTDHETMTEAIIRSAEMTDLWQKMTPPVRAEDIVKLAVGPKKAKHLKFSTWESILSEIIIGDAFGADRMDYLLRDSYHTGVQYGHFDHNRLINTLRILPQEDKETDEPALGLESGGLESSEGLVIARYFIFSQVYYHHTRRVYDLHLIDFLKAWLLGGSFPTSVDDFLKYSDAEVLAAIREASSAPSSPGYGLASRIDSRKHFKRLYTSIPEDKAGGVLIPGKRMFDLAIKEFGTDLIRHDYLPPKNVSPDFPVREYDSTIHSSLKLSSVLQNIPALEVDNIYCDRSILDDASIWCRQVKTETLNLYTQGKLI
jgi:HD superfamily phosphohydrolase